ncbi:MAG: hypothetical protein ACRCR3_03950 [Tannerellaceae bacterium]
MKTILLMLCLASILTSCRTKDETNHKDVIQHDIKSKSYSKEDQIKAIGEIDFFIPKKDFEKKRERFLSQSDNNSTIGLSYILGKYEFLRMDGSFVNDSLIFVSLVGLIYQSDFNTRFISQYNALYDMVQQKYGYPDEKQDLPDQIELMRDKDKICDLWMIGDKYVMIKAVYENGSYFLNFDIARMDIIKRENESRLKSENQAIKNASKQI